MPDTFEKDGPSREHGYATATGPNTSLYSPWDDRPHEPDLEKRATGSGTANYCNQIRYGLPAHQISTLISQPISPEPLQAHSPVSTNLDRSLAQSVSAFVPSSLQTPPVDSFGADHGISNALDTTELTPRPIPNSITTEVHSDPVSTARLPETRDSELAIQADRKLDSFGQARLVRHFIDNWGPGVSTTLIVQYRRHLTKVHISTA